MKNSNSLLKAFFASLLISIFLFTPLFISAGHTAKNTVAIKNNKWSHGAIVTMKSTEQSQSANIQGGLTRLSLSKSEIKGRIQTLAARYNQVFDLKFEDTASQEPIMIYHAPGILTEEQANQLAMDPAIQSVEPDYPKEPAGLFSPDDEQYRWGNQPELSRKDTVDLERAREIFEEAVAQGLTPGEAMVIVFIDSGRHLAHRDQAQSLASGEIIDGSDLVDGGLPIDVESIHGGPISTQLKADTNNQIDIASIGGLSHDVKLYVIRVFGPDRQAFDSDLLGGMNEGSKVLGARFINLSFDGGAPSAIQAYKSAFKALAKNKPGKKSIAIFIAAGNKGLNLDILTDCLACSDAPNVGVVGAVKLSRQLASFSGNGKRVNIGAPGGDAVIQLGRDSLLSQAASTSGATPYGTASGAVLAQMEPNLHSNQLIEKLNKTSLINGGKVAGINAGLLNLGLALEKNIVDLTSVIDIVSESENFSVFKRNPEVKIELDLWAQGEEAQIVVDWGDGTSSPPYMIKDQMVGQADVIVSHKYPKQVTKNKPYTVVVTSKTTGKDGSVLVSLPAIVQVTVIKNKK
jgi:hypothetical protein